MRGMDEQGGASKPRANLASPKPGCGKSARFCLGGGQTNCANRPEMLPLLCCPNCRDANLVEDGEAAICSRCDRRFPVTLGIIDFRDSAVDSTAEVPIGDDRILANLLTAIFPHVSTFNALWQIYEDIRDESAPGARPSFADVKAKLADYPQTPLTEAQKVHGHAILRKAAQYLADVGRQMPKSGIVLENGGSVGLFVDGLAHAFDHLIVLDFCLCFVILAKKLAEEQGITNLTLICASAERLPIRSDCVDFIHSNNVVEHVTNKDEMFKEAHRVLDRNGVLFVVSPNHFSAYIEPHYRLPAYGFIPRSIRKVYFAGKRDIDDVTLVSLPKLRKLLTSHFKSNVSISFIPRRLDETVTGGALRGAIVKWLNSKWFGGIFNFTINRALLPIVPYHVALCFKADAPGRSRIDRPQRK